MLRHCVNLKAIRYESTSLNRIAADKSHRVIAALSNCHITSIFKCCPTWLFWIKLVALLAGSQPWTLHKIVQLRMRFASFKNSFMNKEKQYRMLIERLQPVTPRLEITLPCWNWTDWNEHLFMLTSGKKDIFISWTVSHNLWATNEFAVLRQLL